MPERIFTLADQIAFAELSGDNNPVHVDPVAARRSLFGRPIVHGLHALMWALDQYLEGRSSPVRLQNLHASFLKPIGLNEKVRLSPVASPDNRLWLNILKADEIAVRMMFELVSGHPFLPAEISPAAPRQHPPAPLARETIPSRCGTLNLNLPAELARRLFPNLTRCLCPAQFAVLLATTRLVGVNCPGLHSIYSELKMAVHDTGDLQNLTYAVAEFNDRYGMVLMNFTAPGMAGTIKALVRPPPQVQTSFLDLRKLVAPAAFAGQKALIAGGSRGLGEVTAKLLAAGGAQVQLTYHLGKSDAQAVADEIVAGGGQAGICELNILQPPPDWRHLGSLTELYYFASPRISRSASQNFSPALFHDFCNYFVSGFATLAESLQKTGLRHVYYPSTVFVEEMPAGFVEYVLAKSAGEALCQALEKKYPGLRACCFRLPKMATDQTASLQPVQNSDPAPIILQTLQSFQAGIDSEPKENSGTET